MTISRQNLSFHAAVFEIGNSLGWHVAGDIIGKDAAAVRKYSNPETGREIKLGDAFALDFAMLQKGASAGPINNVYNAKLFGIGNDAHAPDILAMISIASRESGEAIAAGLMAGNNFREIKKAREEFAQAITALTAIYKKLGGE